MTKEKKVSRFESNKQLRQIFSRHSVDLSQMTFSCSTHSLTMNGCLKKNTGGDFTFKGVEALVEEINRLLHHPAREDRGRAGEPGVAAAACGRVDHGRTAARHHGRVE